MVTSITQFSANNTLPIKEKPQFKNFYAQNTVISDKVSFSASPKVVKPSLLSTLKTKLAGIIPQKQTQGRNLTQEEAQEISQAIEKQLKKGNLKVWEGFYEDKPLK
jgi:hypothetical protein